ncbi:ThuA domain-containing protein [Streptomyces thinghirensis]|nr:ThuA domain-containing protein [Streptomyces thinghirensis]
MLVEDRDHLRDPGPARRLGVHGRVVRLPYQSARRGRVLARADESSYEGGGMGDDHPLVWCRDQGAGRVFYTALGHAADAYTDPDFRAHLRGGIDWAARFR